MSNLSELANPEKIKVQEHWNKVYEKSDPEKLGWYEKHARPSIQLIEKCDLPKKARILNVGAGATTLIDDLLNSGYKNLIATDISARGLQVLKDRLAEKQIQVQWIIDDLTNPQKLKLIPAIDLWHDRAVLHFLLEEQEQKSYFDLVRKLVRSNGYVIIATFNLHGTEKCSGLKVHRYDAKMIADRMGPDFNLIQSFDYTYRMPTGNTRDYVYTLFQKTG